MSNQCSCNFCKTHDLYRWAVISECGCGCHKSDHVNGHDELCCAFPNGKMKDNPYIELSSARRYLSILNLLEDGDDQEMKVYDRKRMEDLRLKFESNKYEQFLQKSISVGEKSTIG